MVLGWNRVWLDEWLKEVEEEEGEEEGGGQKRTSDYEGGKRRVAEWSERWSELATYGRKVVE